MSDFEKLFFEVCKNFKLIFRNWSSLILIILAPLLLILLIGYSFSGEELHGIKIGVVTSGYVDLTDFKSNVSGFGEIVTYNKLSYCILQMSMQKIHICMEMKGNLSAAAGEIPSGEINIYYDNTRKRTSLLLISQLKDYFGLTSEKIALISTEQIFSNIQDILVFLGERIGDIDKTRAEAETIRQDLTERRDKLVQVRGEFEPRYEYVKSLQQDFNEQTESFDNKTDSLIESAENAKNLAQAIMMLNLVPENSTEFSALNSTIINLENDIDDIRKTKNSADSRLEKIKESVDSIIAELDMINQSLNEEITSTDNYIALINQSIERMDEIAQEAKAKTAALSAVEPSLASKISKPITQSFTAVVKNARDVQLAFPILLSTVIIFISIIFSNIITSLELNNKAYIRNMLAPVSDLLYTAGMALTNFIIIIVQVAVLLIVTQTRFAVDVFSHLGPMVLIVIVITLLFVFIGMLLAYLSKNIQTSILMSTFVALAFFLFSDTINALESMPALASRIAAYNPVVVINTMLRRIIFFNAALSDMQLELILLIAYAVLAMILLVIVSKIKNRQRLYSKG
jgi:ABC-type multidrug transport system permease subunit